jgi:uncharacterized protein (DUF488 family)
MDQLVKKCFTVGHSNNTLNQFLLLIKKWDIDQIIDVRSVPYSKTNPQFNREPFKKELDANNIGYAFLGYYIGGGMIRFNNSTKNPDFSEIRNNKNFQEGIKILMNFISIRKNVSIMCSEKDPFNCHRFFLISFSLQDKGIIINHILDEKTIISNKELEIKLMQNSSQTHLFQEDIYKNKSLEFFYNQRGLEIFKYYSN